MVAGAVWHGEGREGSQKSVNQEGEGPEGLSPCKVY